MKIRVTFEMLRGQTTGTAFELEGDDLQVVTDAGGWLRIEQAGKFVVAYPPGVVRSVADVGALETVAVKRENPTGRQPTRQAPKA